MGANPGAGPAPEATGQGGGGRSQHRDSWRRSRHERLAQRQFKAARFCASKTSAALNCR